jgi:hypothetical protein
MLSNIRNRLLRCILLYQCGGGENVLVLLSCNRVLVVSPYSMKGKEGDVPAEMEWVGMS